MKDEKLCNEEWLCCALHRLKLTPIGVAVFMAAINLSVDLPLALRFGVLLPNDKCKGLFGEPADWLYEFLVHPMILGYFWWLQKAGAQLIEELARRRTWESRSSTEKILVKSCNHFRSRWISRFCAVVSLIFVIWFLMAFAPSSIPSFYSTPPYPSWLSIHPIIAWIRAPVIFVVFYALSMTILDLGIIIITLNALLRDRQVWIEPFNPDKGGGLSFIGRFSADLGYLIGTLGILMSVRILQATGGLSDWRNYVIMFGFGAYLLLTPLIFFLPLWSAHTVMRAFRDDLLTGIALDLDSTVTQLRDTSWKDVDKIEKFLGDYKQRDEMRELILTKIPVWPFNMDSLKKFLGLIFSPLAPPIISFVVDFVQGVVSSIIL